MYLVVERRQVAIVRDEVAEKQRVIEELRSQAIAAQAQRGPRESHSWAWLSHSKNLVKVS